MKSISYKQNNSRRDFEVILKTSIGVQVLPYSLTNYERTIQKFHDMLTTTYKHDRNISSRNPYVLD